MVLTLQIDKIESSLYRAAVLCGGVEVTEPSHYASIEEAIREEATAVPEGFAYFADVIYGGGVQWHHLAGPSSRACLTGC